VKLTLRQWSFRFLFIHFFVNCLQYCHLQSLVSFDHGIGMIFRLNYSILVWKRYDLQLKFGMKMVWFSDICVWSQYWQQWIRSDCWAARPLVPGNILLFWCLTLPPTSNTGFQLARRGRALTLCDRGASLNYSSWSVTRQSYNSFLYTRYLMLSHITY